VLRISPAALAHRRTARVLRRARRITGRLGYFYFEEEPHRRSAAKLLTATRSGGSSQSMDVARAEVGIVYSVRKSRRSRSQCPGIVGMS